MEFSKLLDYFSKWEGRASMMDHALRFEAQGAVGYFDHMRLTSVFQPILARDTLRPMAYEALLRVQDAAGNSINPQDAFKRPTTSEEVIFLDRLCRVIHAVNFFRQVGHDSDASLFLNVDGRHLLALNNGEYGRTFETLLEYCGVRPQQVVLEIVESLVANSDHLIEAVAAYQARGYRIAIDDFGARESNFDRLWKLSPNIVKLDRDMIVQSVVNPRARRVLPKLIEIMHDLGATVVCEGIEDTHQHNLVMAAGTDLLQGYHYAMPHAVIDDTSLTVGPPPKNLTPQGVLPLRAATKAIGGRGSRLS